MNYIDKNTHNIVVYNIFLPEKQNKKQYNGIVDRGLCQLYCSFVLSTVGLGMFIFFMTRFLVNAKKDELEENNRRVQGVIDKVTTLSEQLGDASESLLALRR